jgi:hypothetical protein
LKTTGDENKARLIVSTGLRSKMFQTGQYPRKKAAVSYNSQSSIGIQPGKVKTRFVQDYGRMYCQHAGLFALISEEHGFTCRCRNPRCSFECKRAWSEKESALDEFLLSKLPPGYRVYRGSLKLPKDANADDHEEAKARFSRHINQTRKAGAVLEFKAYAHDTDPYNRHWDYLLYSDLSAGAVFEAVQTGAGKAGFTASCVPVGNDLDERQRWAAYNTKLNQQPGRTPGEYIFLPADDGSRLIWNSKGWYHGYKKEALWVELRQQWAQSPKKISNISTTPKEAVRRQLYKVLPERAEEACSIFKIAWLVRWPNGVPSRLRLLTELLAEMVNVKEEGGRYYLLDFRRMPHAKKVFGDGPICYHAEHWPLPPDVDDICKPADAGFGSADWLARIDQMSDDDFLKWVFEDAG